MKTFNSHEKNKNPMNNFPTSYIPQPGHTTQIHTRIQHDNPAGKQHINNTATMRVAHWDLTNIHTIFLTLFSPSKLSPNIVCAFSKITRVKEITKKQHKKIITIRCITHLGATFHVQTGGYLFCTTVLLTRHCLYF